MEKKSNFLCRLIGLKKQTRKLEAVLRNETDVLGSEAGRHIGYYRDMPTLIERLNALERKPQFLALQKLVVLNNKNVQRLFPWIWGAIVGFAALGAAVFIIDFMAYVWWYEIGVKFGQLALLCYAITLLPGILRRFGVFPLARTMLMLTRRQMGITTFYLVLCHLSLVLLFPTVLTGSSFLPLRWFVIFGSFSFDILFLMWLSSNDTAVKKLGKWWKWVHKLTYIAVFTIFLHVALQGKSWTALFALIVLATEVISWIYPRVIAAQKPLPAPQTPQQS